MFRMFRTFALTFGPLSYIIFHQILFWSQLFSKSGQFFGDVGLMTSSKGSSQKGGYFKFQQIHHLHIHLYWCPLTNMCIIMHCIDDQVPARAAGQRLLSARFPNLDGLLHKVHIEQTSSKCTLFDHRPHPHEHSLQHRVRLPRGLSGRRGAACPDHWIKSLRKIHRQPDCQTGQRATWGGQSSLSFLIYLSLTTIYYISKETDSRSA